MFRLFQLIILTSFFSSCEKEINNPDMKSGKVNIKINYKVDGQPLRFYKMIYKNEAGNKYSVWTLHYVLSGFTFYKTGGMSVISDAVFYVDAEKPELNNLTFENIPQGSYNGFSFIIGIDSIHNVWDSIPATTDFQGMLWPQSMGGGYHFLKLEGQYHTASSDIGYTMHVGENGFTSLNTMDKTFSITQNNLRAFITMNMNINEWFAHPMTYDFNTDGNSSMGDTTLMFKLALNGTDVFFIQ